MTQNILSTVPSSTYATSHRSSSLLSSGKSIYRSDKTVRELHCRFRFYGKNAREWMRKCVLMLPDLDRERVWEKKGFGSLSEYAGRLSGMSKDTVHDGLRVLRAVEGMPDIMKVIEERGINCIKPIVTLLTHDNQKFWADKARVMSRHTLEMYRREWEGQQITSGSMDLLEHTPPVLDIFGRTGPSETDNSPHREAIGKIDRSQQDKSIVATEVTSSSVVTITMTLNPEIASALQKLRGNDGDWNTLMEELLELRRAKLERELLLLRAQKLEREKPLQKPSKQQGDSQQKPSRHIPIAIQRFIIKRSRGICEVGACKQSYKIFHHTQRFALEQTHAPDKIIALCTSHERLVHLGLIEDEYIAPKKWKILEQPDRTNHKYHIDQLVQKYRRLKVVSERYMTKGGVWRIKPCCADSPDHYAENVSTRAR